MTQDDGGAQSRTDGLPVEELPGGARAAIEAGEYDLIVLDEFTYPLKFGWVAWPEVEAVLKARDPKIHVVITGRDALPELIELADTVSEINPVKHAYAAGIGAQTGIEY